MRNNTSPANRYAFLPVKDSRKRRVRGLWIRNGRFYVQMRVLNAEGMMRPRKLPLKANNLEGCRVEMAKKLLAREQGEILPAPGPRPSFAVSCDRYLKFFEGLEDAGKRATTVHRENSSLVAWRKQVGAVRVDKITKPMITGFIEKRLKAGIAPRTVNLDLIALRNVLKRARDDGYLTTLPIDGIKPLKANSPTRPLLKPEELVKLCQVARTECPRTGELLADFLRSLAYSGAREQEALRLTWDDVHFDRRQLVIGADGLAKNRRSRVVDFNANLEAHLRELHQRRAPDSRYLFPSPRRKPGEDRPCQRLRSALETVRDKAGLPHVGFHDLRHFFTSYCVMSGIDFKTIAEWLGHESGTMLIDRIYGHLAADHKQRMAQKVSFINTPPVASPSPQGQSSAHTAPTASNATAVHDDCGVKTG